MTKKKKKKGCEGSRESKVMGQRRHVALVDGHVATSVARQLHLVMVNRLLLRGISSIGSSIVKIVYRSRLLALSLSPARSRRRQNPFLLQIAADGNGKTGILNSIASSNGDS
ncbi:hypothetical protein DM860_012276 [Cuscuta australis]|uniref:Uncharacterized protein n=1 Tax=Cuscuta australis TaxID=267555 RepID=A0A328EAV8_9ASTE|nr:hypothetical protein DM860_012276 [Cuscuta australis]